MEILFLENDGRCRWLEKKVLKGIYTDAMKNIRNPKAKRQYMIIDWISNDNGKVGVDLKWFKILGISAVKSYKDLPKSHDYAVINAGYDSIVHEEKFLREKGIEIIDEPCPFIRRLRKLLEAADSNYQYILLCEPNHIIVKNFASIFPPDMILVQMKNYQKQIVAQANGKPFMLLPYVTFLPNHAAEIMAFLEITFPNNRHHKVDTHCMWIKSKASPIVEINQLDDSQLKKIDTALLITGPASSNKSLISLLETLEERGLPVVIISTLKEYLNYEKSHSNAKVLIVRSPIPNNTENEVMAYINHGYAGALFAHITNNRWLKAYLIGSINKIIYCTNWLKLKFKLEAS